MAIDLNNKSIKFLVGDNFVPEVKHRHKIEDGIIYFDSENKKIILGQNNGINAGENYKIYSDLYQTLFYADGSWNSEENYWEIIVAINESTETFFKNNLVSLRINFKNATSSFTTNNFYLITKQDYEFNSSNGINLTSSDTSLYWTENSFLDFLYIPKTNGTKNLLTAAKAKPTSTPNYSSWANAGTNKLSQHGIDNAVDGFYQVIYPTSKNNVNTTGYCFAPLLLITLTAGKSYVLSGYIKAESAGSIIKDEITYTWKNGENKKVTWMAWTNDGVIDPNFENKKNAIIFLTEEWQRFEIAFKLKEGTGDKPVYFGARTVLSEDNQDFSFSMRQLMLEQADYAFPYWVPGGTTVPDTSPDLKILTMDYQLAKNSLETINNNFQLLNNNRLMWVKNNKIYSDNHYANENKIAINFTNEPTENFYVNGTSKFNGQTIFENSTRVNADLTANSLVINGQAVFNNGLIGNLTGNATTATIASKLGTATLGSATKPIYLSSGVAIECKSYAGGTAVTLNGESKATSTATFYAPIASGDANTQALVSKGVAAPDWVDISPSITIGAGTSSAAPTIKVTVLGQSGMAKSITKATTEIYGVTKLSSNINSDDETLAATPKAVKITYDKAASAYDSIALGTTNRMAYYSADHTISAAQNHIYSTNKYTIQNSTGGADTGFTAIGLNHNIHFMIGASNHNRGIYDSATYSKAASYDENTTYYTRSGSEGSYTYTKITTGVTSDNVTDYYVRGVGGWLAYWDEHNYGRLGPKIGINGSNTNYTFYVNGTTYMNGTLYGKNTTYMRTANGTRGAIRKDSEGEAIASDATGLMMVDSTGSYTNTTNSGRLGYLYSQVNSKGSTISRWVTYDPDTKNNNAKGVELYYPKTSVNESYVTYFRPTEDNVLALGSYDRKWKNIYAITFTGDLDGTADKANKDGSGNVITSTYATKTDLNNLLAANGALYKGSTYNSGEILTATSSGAVNTITKVPISQGGTNATTEADALINLIGTSPIGGTKIPIYWTGSAFSKLGTEGTTTKPIYLNNGVLTSCTYELKATVNAGTVNQIAYYSSANTISSKAPAWRDWDTGADGPKAKIQIGNIIYTSAAIPAANGTTTAGVISTGAQTFGGNKTFSGTLTVNEATTLNSTLRVTGNTNIQGNLNVTGNTTLNNTTNISELIASSLIVNGNSTFNNTVQFINGAVGSLEGNATSADKLTVQDTGSNRLPVYFEGGIPKEIVIADLRSNLGLSNALHFIGITTTEITDGGTQNPNISGQSYTNKINGDVVLYQDSTNNIDKEFVWTGSKWELLGRDSSFALNDEVVKIFGDQTINGRKTFENSTRVNADLTTNSLIVNGQAVFNNGLIGNLTGNAATATALTSDAGSSTLPVYFSNGKPAVITNLAIDKTTNTGVYARVKNAQGGVSLYVQNDGVRGVYNSTASTWIVKVNTNNTIGIPEWANIGNTNTNTNPINMDSNGRPQAITFTASKAIVSDANGGLASMDLEIKNTDITSGSNNNVINFVSEINQDSYGKISYTTQSVREATNEISGIVSIADQSFKGQKTIIHTKDQNGDFRTKYGTTVDMWFGVGGGNENHGIYDSKASRWIIASDATATNGKTVINRTNFTNAITGTTIGTDTKIEGTMTISGNLIPAVTNTYDIGTTSLKWKNIYATTFTGDLDGTAAAANRLKLIYCRDDSTPTNKGLWNIIKNTGTETTRNQVNFYTIYNTSESNAPSTYGEVLEIISYNNKGGQSQFWFDTVNDNENLYYRNKKYNGTTFSDWRQIAFVGDTIPFSNVSGIVPISQGGTNASTASNAILNLIDRGSPTEQNKLNLDTINRTFGIWYIGKADTYTSVDTNFSKTWGNFIQFPFLKGQIFFNHNTLQFRQQTGNPAEFKNWNNVLHSNNYTDYFVAGNNITLTKENGSLTIAATIPDISVDKITGTLPIAKGGTGASSFTANRIIISGTSTTGALTTLAAGTADTQALVSGGSAIPKWVTISPSITIGAGTNSAAPTVNVTVLGRLGTAAQSITIAATNKYGVTKLSSSTDSDSETLAATPKAIKAAYDKAVSASYCGSVATSANPQYDTEPEVKSIKIGNSTGPQPAEKSVSLQYDAALGVLNFVFV